MAQINNALQFRAGMSRMDTEKIAKMENFYAQGNGTPAQLTRKLIYYLGRKSGSFPLATKLLGGSYFDMSNISEGSLEDQDSKNMYLKSTVKESKTDEYTYPVMGEYIDGGVIAQNVTGSTIGIGCSDFEVPFETNYLHKGFLIQSPRGIQLYVNDIKQKPDGLYWYSLKIANGNNLRVCPESELVSGTVWINMFAPVAQSGSRNINIGRAVLPGANKNQLTKMRCGFTWEADTADAETTVYIIEDNKPQTVDLKSNDSSPKMKWIDQYTYNFELDCLKMIESCLWYGQYNKNQDGTVGLTDNFNGKVINIGSGLLEQIINKISYNNFSYSFLTGIIGRGLYGIKGQSKEKTLYTGTLGNRIFDAAMKKEGISKMGIAGFTGASDKFITGNNYSLMLGGYFDGYYDVDGWIIKIKVVDTFDNSIVTNSPIDPVSQLPLESARMVLVDDGDCEGESNLQLLVGKGYNPYVHGIKIGMNKVPDSIKLLSNNNSIQKSDGGVNSVTTDLEESTYMRIFKVGCQLLRGNTSFDFRYTPY